MADWVQYVREHLRLDGIAPEREAAIIAELAQQLEQAAAAGRNPEHEVSDWPALARCLERELPRRGGGWLGDGVGDARYALRSWRKARGFVIAAVLTLALGIGAATAMFSAMNAVMLRRWFPSVSTSNLVYVWMPSHRIAQAPVDSFGPSYGAFTLFRKHVHAFTDATLFTQQAISVESAATTVRVGSAQVRPNFFSMLGATPLAGRTFTAADAGPGGLPVAILSQPLARSAFGSARAALGKVLVLDGKRTRIVGVLPAAFNFPSSLEAPGGDRGLTRNDTWLPLVLNPS
ncbi:MAG: ABC transporter permease, partial [Terriglobales bacterium]